MITAPAPKVRAVPLFKFVRLPPASAPRTAPTSCWDSTRVPTAGTLHKPADRPSTCSRTAIPAAEASFAAHLLVLFFFFFCTHRAASDASELFLTYEIKKKGRGLRGGGETRTVYLDHSVSALGYYELERRRMRTDLEQPVGG